MRNFAYIVLYALSLLAFHAATLSFGFPLEPSNQRRIHGSQSGAYTKEWSNTLSQNCFALPKTSMKVLHEDPGGHLFTPATETSLLSPNGSECTLPGAICTSFPLEVARPVPSTSEIVGAVLEPIVAVRLTQRYFHETVTSDLALIVDYPRTSVWRAFCKQKHEY